MWLLQGTSTVRIEDNLQDLPQGAQLAGSSMTQLIVTLIDGAIIIGALALLLYLILGAFSWIISGGDKGKVEAARNKIVQALVGFVVLVFVYTIYLFVLNVLDINLGQASGGGGNATANTNDSGSGGPRSCNSSTVNQYASDGGAGQYCSGGGSARVRCFGPGEGVSGYSYYHWEPCYCQSGSELSGYDFSSC